VRIDGRQSERALVASFFPRTAEFRATVGLCAARGLCLLLHSLPATADGEGVARYPLVARCFGEHSALSGPLIDGLHAWIAAGRPHGDELRIRAYPPAPPYAPARHEALVVTPWTQFVLDKGAYDV
jgi:hypothetical protein